MDLSEVFHRAVRLHQSDHLAEAKSLYDQILAVAPDQPDTLHARGVVDLQQGRYGDALERFDRALALNPSSIEALNSRAAALGALGRRAEAVAACDAVLALNPSDLRALVVRAVALNGLSRHDEAVAACGRALALLPDSTELLVARAKSRAALTHYEAALGDFETAFALDPGLTFIPAMALFAAMRICWWDGFADKVGDLLRRIDAGELGTWPFLLLALPSSPLQQKNAAELFFRHNAPARDAAVPAAPRQGGKMRLGYFSEDFRGHPVSHLIRGLLAAHDRARFEVVAFALVGSPVDPVRQEIVKAVDRLIDVSAMADADIAALSRREGIHIGLDLNVHAGRQLGIFARGVAPVQVNYLGYPGTSGAGCYDYIIGDPVITPLAHRADFSEHIVMLPHTYQANDLRRYASLRAFTRRELNLPESGFVFCCFNDSFKITPDVFDIWMRLLAAVEGSVLWLLQSDPAAMRNLRREAQARGVAPARLIFAPRVSLEDHLARHRAADLFLDTFHYNAHTTASDALWMGLPLVTRLGEAFAARVAAGLLTAAGMPELIAADSADYEKLAIGLATQPDTVARVKTRLAENRLTCPLFDTSRYTRNIETAYGQMWQRFEAGLPPDHMTIVETRAT